MAQALVATTAAAILTTALGEAYITIMKMMANDEISEKDIGTKVVQDKLKAIFAEKIEKNKKA